LAAAGEAAPVGRAMAELSSVAEARGAKAEPIEDPDAALVPLRELVDRASGGAVVRAALPHSAQAGFAEAGVRADRNARILADAACRLPEPRRAAAGAHLTLRPLRALPADVPDLRRARRGDGLAARPHPAHEERLGRPARGRQPGVRRSHGEVPRLPRL